MAEALSEFDLRAAALLLDSEVRDTVVGTAYAALGGCGLAGRGDMVWVEWMRGG